PFDATPRITGTVNPDWAPDPNHPNVGPSSSTGVGGINPSTGASDEPGGAPHKNELDPGGTTGDLTPTSSTQTWWWWTIAGAVALLVLLLLPAVRRTGLRRQRLRARPGTAQAAVDEDVGPPGEMRIVVSPAVVIREAHAVWEEFLDTLVDFGIPLDPAQTPRETVARIARSLSIGGEAAQALRLLARSEERARYARTPLEVDHLGRAVRTVRAAIASRA